MNKTLLILIAFIFGLTASIALLAGSEGHDDDDYYETRDDRDEHDDDEHDEHGSWLRGFFGSAEAAGFGAWRHDPASATYGSECGGCHIAYPPDMLPAAAWHQLMLNLDDHFGDNAELDDAATAEIDAFLTRYSDQRPVASGPVRITQTRWFRAQHHEIPVRMVTNNPGVQDFSRCDACHTRAGQGSFNEHDVRIPGYGRWDD